MAADLSKPRPEHTCQYHDSHNSWLCEGCEWDEAHRARHEAQFMTRKYEVDNALQRILRGFKPSVLKHLDVAIRHSKNNSVAQAELEELRMLLAPLQKFKENDDYLWHYDERKARDGLWKTLGRVMKGRK